MATIVTRSGKGVSLTHNEVDANFTNLNTDKAEVSDVILATEKGAASGVAPLDATSKISSTYLPSYVDDVLEYANYAALPATGETGKIYVALDTNKTYRWSGSAYIYITSGAVDSVAGKTGVVTLDKTDVGLSNVSNTAQVTSVTGTSPIISSGGVTPSISISAATTTDAGSMSAADKAKIDAVTGTNTGDETASTIKTKLGITTLSGSNTGDQTITLTGDITGSGSGSFVTTLATITDSGTGTFKKVTTNSKGLVTGSVAVAQADITGLLGAGSISNTMLANSAVANLSGTNTGDQVIPVASSTTPAALGTAAVGTGTTFARADHVHTLPSLATLGAQAAGSYVTVGGALGTPSSGTLTNCTFPTLNQNTTGSSGSCTGNAATATNATNATNYVGGTGVTVGNTAAFASANDTTLSVRGTSTTAATMSFHRPGAYAANFGIDTDNILKYGGWSAGSVYPVYHGGNPQPSVTGSSGSCTGNAATSSSCTGNAATATSATYLNSSNYIQRTGSSGNANTDFQNTPAGSVRHNGDDANLTNGPGNAWWFYNNYRHSNGGNYWGTQVAWGWEDNANRLATRNVTNGSFGGWVYYLNSANYTSYAPSLTGGGASGTWGINVTGSSTSCTGNAASSSGSLGNGQSWQNVLGSRAKNTTYTNSTGRSIMVNIVAYQTGGAPVVNCQGVSIALINGSGSQVNASFICPNGGTYIYASTVGTITYWAELR